MQLDPYVDQVRHQLTATAALGDEHTQNIAATLIAATAPAVRLTIMAALGEAAQQITAALLDAPGAPSVSVRLADDDVQVEVRTADTEPDDAPRSDDGEPSARISLRLPEALKADVEQAAARDGVSVNAWLLRAAAGALSRSTRGGHGRRGNNSQRVTGWING
ncbi:MAG: histidine kinase [Jatrophihabitantaceae bacterium]